MRKLRIAVTADTYLAATDRTSLVRAPFAPRGLAEALHMLGAIPCILADVPGALGADYAEAFDGLVLPGGLDSDPTLFGEEPVWGIGETNYKRDVFEIELFRAFRAAGKPVFGICRGMQLMNLILGGTVYQDLQSQCPAAYIRHKQKADGTYPTHHVAVTPGSVVFHAIGAEAYVNSRHHQAVKEAAPGLSVTAKAPDGVIEALESADGQLVGVQWHPEDLWREDAGQRQLFQDFLDRCSEEEK